MVRSLAIAVPILLQAVPQTVAWGAFGHEAVAYVAQDFITSSTAAFAKKALSDSSADFLAKASTWADSYRSTAAGKFSSPFHYIDAEDKPPSSCGVDFARDCGKEGCVVSAIANYTQRVKDSSLSSGDVTDALKFIIHFLGDIHQPLHDEGLALGGNEIDVKFDGKSTNLHSVWDTSILEKYAGSSSLSGARSFASNLTSEIKNGKYASKKKSWLDGIDIKDATKSAMVWASDGNALVCSSVMANGTEAVESGDLGGAYFKGTAPVVETQIAKAGFRLAAWLNLIVDGKTGLVRREEDIKPIDIHVSLPSAQLYRTLSPAKLARRAAGFGCGHEH